MSETRRAPLMSKRWTPFRAPPTTKASPSTSRTFARTEPTIVAVATSYSLLFSAKSTTKSSGRLPSALWTTPVPPAPSRSPSASTLRPTRLASSASATPEMTNGAMLPPAFA